MKKRILVAILVLALVMCLAPGALAANTINPMYSGDPDMMAAANAVDFYAIDAYGNRLPDEVTIASGGSFFVGFETNINPSNQYLFWNVGWNLSSLTSITYDNQIPAPENNYVGGIHIDVAASAGQTVDLDFYICPRNNSYNPPVNWGTMTSDYVIKKVVRINIVGGTSSLSGAEGSAAFQKPVPDGYSLSVTDGTVDPHYVQPGGAVSKAVDLTVKTDTNGDYPITKNSMNITMDMPDGLAGKDSYVAKYINPYTGAVETHPVTVQNGDLVLSTDHMSPYVIEGYDAANVPKTGDDTPLALLIGLVLACSAGLAVSCWIRRRNA